MRISPSAIADYFECKLKGQRTALAVRGLAATPLAKLGSWIHAQIEKPGRFDSQRAAYESACKMEVYIPLTGEFKSLSEVVNKQKIQSRVMKGVPINGSDGDCASSHSSRSGNSARKGRQSAIKAGDLGIGNFREQTITNALETIAGRPDQLRIDYDEVVITDTKTGHILNLDGTIKAHIEDQMYAYSFIVRDTLPEVPIRLIVEQGSKQFELQRVTELEDEKHERIRKAIAELVVNPDVPKEAEPGEACLFCPYRKDCSTYQCHAPEWWLNLPDYLIPQDIFGTIDHCDSKLNGWIITDFAGRKAVVSGLPDSVFTLGRKGRRFLAFQVGISGGRGADDARHPLNFYFYAKDGSKALTAWNMEIVWLHDDPS